MSLTLRILSYTLRIFRDRGVRSTESNPCPWCVTEEGIEDMSVGSQGTDPIGQAPNPAPWYACTVLQCVTISPVMLYYCAIVQTRGERIPRKTEPPRNRVHDASPRAQHALGKAALLVGPALQGPPV